MKRALLIVAVILCLTSLVPSQDDVGRGWGGVGYYANADGHAAVEMDFKDIADPRPGDAPAFVLVVRDLSIPRQVRISGLVAVPFDTMDEVTGYLESHNIAEELVIGVWPLKPGDKIQLTHATAPVAVPEVKHKWQKKP